MISFRLTEDEHERFRQLCFTHGIRSVSELARVAMSNYFEQPSRVVNDALETRVNELESRIHVLSNELKRINQNGHHQTVKFPLQPHP
jgi:hypothetical protein